VVGEVEDLQLLMVALEVQEMVVLGVVVLVVALEVELQAQLILEVEVVALALGHS
jgi:hypothetical protein